MILEWDKGGAIVREGSRILGRVVKDLNPNLPGWYAVKGDRHVGPHHTPESAAANLVNWDTEDG